MPIRRTFLVAPILTVVGLTIAGCGTPAPAPSRTIATTEAYAAAEMAYRAYVEALNRVNLGDSTTFDAVAELTDGEADAQAKKDFSRMHAEGWTVSGQSRVAVLEPVEFNGTSVDLAVCLDVSEVDVVNANGESQVEPDRVDVQSLAVGVASVGDRWLVTSIEGREGLPSCGA